MVEKMKKLIILLALMMLINPVNAFTVDSYARKTTNFEPLENVHLFLLCNDTNVTLDGFTDSTGLYSFTGLAEGNYSLNAEKPTYNNRTLDFYVDDSFNTYSYLSRTSDSGIQFNFNDLTFFKHEWCFYTEENRLFGCYRENDTLFLSADHNYTAKPKLNMIEQAGFIDIRGFLMQISIFVIVIGCIIALGVIVIVVSLYLGRKMLRR
jgi:hypothetical protein